MLTDEQVEEIRTREEKATEGPWIAEKIVYNKYEQDAYFEISGPGKTDESVGYYPRDIVQSIVRELAGESDLLAQDESNTAFIAHARTDIPALLDDREEMRKLLREAVMAIKLSRHGMNFHANEFLSRDAVQELVK